jgi:hypothetical protein
MTNNDKEERMHEIKICAHETNGCPEYQDGEICGATGNDLGPWIVVRPFVFPPFCPKKKFPLTPKHTDEEYDELHTRWSRCVNAGECIQERQFDLELRIKELEAEVKDFEDERKLLIFANPNVVTFSTRQSDKEV